MASVFDDFSDHYDSWFETPIGMRVREYELDLLLELLEPSENEKILDAGCGTGMFTHDFIKKGSCVTGLDLSGKMLKKASVKLNISRFDGVVGDMTALPFADAVFDKAVSVTAVEFVPENIDWVLGELFRVVKPGGVVVVATLNSLSPWNLKRMQEVREGRNHIFSFAKFRSPAELLGLRPEAGLVRTAIHFSEDELPGKIAAVEATNRFSMLGAFLAVRWQKAC